MLGGSPDGEGGMDMGRGFWLDLGAARAPSRLPRPASRSFFVFFPEWTSPDLGI